MGRYRVQIIKDDAVADEVNVEAASHEEAARLVLGDDAFNRNRSKGKYPLRAKVYGEPGPNGASMIRFYAVKPLISAF